MNYEEKKIQMAIAIIDATKLVLSDENPTLDFGCEHIKDIKYDEALSILYQFERDGKLEILEIFNPFEGYFPPPIPARYKIKVKDKDYFFKLIAQATSELNVVDSIQNTIKNNHFFVEYKSDRNIRLNGKILLSKPQFGRDNESIFKWLYDNPNTIYKKEELEKQLGIVISDKFQKITDRWGFRAGLKDTFFDIHEDTINPEKSTIKFKNPVTL